VRTFVVCAIALLQTLGGELDRQAGRHLTINATGAIGAIGCELGLDEKIMRGLGVMARAVGLVGHLLEESREPMAGEIWHRVEEEATEELRKK